MKTIHDSGLDRLLEGNEPPSSWTGSTRPGKGWTRHPPRALRRNRWRQLAKAESQAATDAGEPDVARAFDAVLATLDLTEGQS